MSIESTLLSARRRHAAGIDLGPRELRLVVVSRHGRGVAPVRVEWLSAVPLTGGAIAGAQIVDQAAVAAALTESFAQLPDGIARRPLTCAMAVPGSATVVASVPLARLMPHTPGVSPMRVFAGLEPAVLAEAERVAGIERNALAIDWFIDEVAGAPSVTIAATPRAHLDARIEVAAAAGIELSTLDGEPPAALRALRQVAELELNPHERYAALWVGGDGVYGWRIGNDMIGTHVRYPAPEHDDLTDALRALADGDELGCVLLGGDLDLLGGAGLAPADIGDVLGCSVLPFECAAFCDASSRVPPGLREAPAFAVAFGLALRGVFV
jgi:Tfp pilus assembly PilM family ATPase